MSFRLPSLDSPSTPDRKNRSLFSQPSTTPQAPPPTYLSNPSTTPAGQPPTPLFGSSRRPTSRLTFDRRSSGPRGSNAPSSPPGYEDDEDDEDGNAYDKEEFEPQAATSPSKSAFMSSIMSSARGLKRSRTGEIRSQQNSELAALARGIARQSTRQTKLHEPDDVVIRQNDILGGMDSDIQQHPRKVDAMVTNGAAQLTSLWSHYANTSTKEGGVGPASDIGMDKAQYIGSLLLQLHHPNATSNRSVNSKTPAKRTASCPVPRALLDWLEAHHTPFPDDFQAIHLHQPSPADHERFWDVVFASLARGKYDQAINLLRDAGWENAVTAMDDFPQSQPQGYSGKQLDNVQEVVADCLEVLGLCPALVDGDWDTKNQAWTMFRHRVRQAAKRLEAYAGEEEEELDQSNMFQRSARMSMRDDFTLSAASRRAESKVPWSVFENLKLVYGLVLGGVDELLDTSQDWLEASVFLTVWWDGADETTGKKGGQKPREVDVSPLTAYRKRLSDAFNIVTNDEETETVLQVNTMDPVQVALACSLDNAVEGALTVMRTWSSTVTTAVVEIAAWSGWLPQGRPRSAGLLQRGFSSEDLMVLSRGPGQQPPAQTGELDRDEVLLEYADLLRHKEFLLSSDGKTKREGWELAVSVLGRLDDTSLAQRRIDSLLADIALTDETRVDRVLNACHELELTAQARAISERYADTLATSLQTSGPALMFYARAHAGSKIKDMLKNMTSICLLHSAAVPSGTGLDEQLASLLGSERPALVELARSDPEGAALLAAHLSGYATLRKFYNLRDGGSQSLERQRAAANALLAVTESAADCIRGGLFDRSVESAVSVDGVLALLGEALPLLGQKKRILTKDQIFALLRIVEDFATSPGRIRENAESLLQASINSYRDVTAGSGMLRKTRSNVSSRSGLTGSSYDMLASSVIGQSPTGVKFERAWDWRKGLDGFTSQVGAKEVLTLIRLALAQEIGRGWSGELYW